MNSPKPGARRSSASPSTVIGSDRSSTPNRRGDVADTDFIIGDRVLVGTKPGIIAYLGDVKFAAGDFAGVVLDEPVGKNDGSVKGTRYFQCEMMRGVFVRTSKLVRNAAAAALSSSTRASPRFNYITSSTSPKPPASRNKLSSSSSSGPSSTVEVKRFSPLLSLPSSVPDCQNKSGEQMERIQKEYENLMLGTRKKFEEFQQRIEQLESENSELHKTVEEQKSQIEDLQFQLEEEVLSKEDIMQELVNEKNNNKVALPTMSDQLLSTESSDLKAEELKKQLDDSLLTNSALKEELEQAKSHLSDIEFQLAESEMEKENELKEKKKLEDRLHEYETQTAASHQDNAHASQSLTLLSQQLADRNRQLEILQESYSKSEEKVRQLKEKINNLQNQSNHDKDIFSQSQTALEDQHKTDIDYIRKEYLLDLNRLQDDLTKNVTNLHNEHRETVEQLQSQRSQQVGQLQIQHSEQVEQLQTEHTQAIELLQTEHTQAMEQLQTENTQAIERLQHHLRRLQADYEEQSAASCSNCTSHLAQVERLHTQLTQLQRSTAENISHLNGQVSALTAERRQLAEVLNQKSRVADKLKQQVSETHDRLICWQKEVKHQIESNKQKSEEDLDCLKTELGTSQALLIELEKKLGLSEDENARLQSRVNMLSKELYQSRQALVATSPRIGAAGNSNGTYRDTSDFLFNQLKRQVEVMELSMFKTTEEDLRLKEENEQLRAELCRVKYEMNSQGSPRRNSQPRTFCDLCQAFDLHPTSECDRRLSSCGSQSSQATKLPLCNICLSQRHWTADCTVDE